jgi:uncharacterized glyoxalase superfamily protein PhnB
VLLTNEELFRGSGGPGSDSVRLYFHIEEPVDVLHKRIVGEPDVRIVQGPTDQHWNDRTLMVRDPWGVLLVFSNPVTVV